MTPDQASSNIAELAQRAYEDLLRRIRAGESPRAAADAALAAFRSPYYQQVADALNALLETSLGPAEVKAWPVGRVKLSQALYAHHRAISAATTATVNAHLQGLHSARDLAKTLYEGYEFKPDTLKVVAKLPKYLRGEFDRALAAKLKTPALRAAYLQAIQAAEAGAGQAALEKVLKVAFYERNRYLANRIARTEIARAQNVQIARELLADDQIGFVQIRLSSKHPKPDICDLHAKLDAYGLGPGVYPKAEAPLPPYHPACFCLTRPILTIPPGQKAKAQPNAARAFLKALPADEARQVMGGTERLRRVLEDRESVEDVVNTNVDPLYHARRMGEAKQIAIPSENPTSATWREAAADSTWRNRLEGFKSGAGWLEEGGRLLRDAEGNVTGRTKWQAKEQWRADYVAANGSGRVAAKNVPAIIDKALNGKRLGSSEEHFMRWLFEYSNAQTALAEQADDLVALLPQNSKILLDGLMRRFAEHIGDQDVVNETIGALMEEAYTHNPNATIDDVNKHLIKELESFLDAI